jgi:hypothetical protein
MAAAQILSQNKPQNQSQNQGQNQTQAQPQNGVAGQLLQGNMKDPRARIVEMVMNSASRNARSNPWLAMAVLLGALIATESLLRNQPTQGQQMGNSGPTPPPLPNQTGTATAPLKLTPTYTAGQFTTPPPKPPEEFAKWVGPKQSRIQPVALTEALQTPGPTKVGPMTMGVANAISGATPAQAAAAPTKSLSAATTNLTAPTATTITTAATLATKAISQGHTMP